MKKSLSLVICLLMLIGLLPTGNANAAVVELLQNKTKIMVEEMTEHSDGVVPSAGMAIRTNMWFGYEVISPVEDDFDFILTFGYMTNFSLRITVNGEQQFSGGFSVDSEKDGIYTTNICKLHLKKGLNKIRIEKVPGMGDYHIQYFVLKSVGNITGDKTPTSGAYKNHYFPACIEAEDYDYGSTYSKKNKSYSNEYREDGALKLTAENDGYAVELPEGSGCDYSVNVDYDGYYNIAFKMTGFGKVAVRLDNKVLAERELSASANDKTCDFTTAYMKKGKYVLNVESLNGTVSLDAIYVSSAEYKENIPADGENNNNENNEEHSVYKTIYVAENGDDNANGEKNTPFATIEKAVEAASALTENMTGDIIIYVADGSYFLSKPLVLDNAISGKNGYNVIIKGYGDEKPLVSGGKKISGWQDYNEYIKYAEIPGIDNVYNMYINDRIATRARSKYRYAMTELYKEEDSEYESDGMILERTNFPEFSKPQELEFVWTNEWTSNRAHPVSMDYNDKNVVIKMQQPCWETGTTKPYATTRISGGNFYIENAMELLDEPGEYYFDKEQHRLYYYPQANDDLNTAYVGGIENMVQISGESKDNKINNLVLDGLRIRHGESSYAAENGIIFGQAGSYYGTDGVEKEFPAMITVTNAENVFIQNCDISNTGCSGILFASGVSSSVIRNNVVYDVGGSGIVAGSNKHTNNMPEGEEICSNVTIRNNAVARAAQINMGTIGICLYYVNGATIAHNEVEQLPYTGMSLGWGWGLDVADCKSFQVYGNKVSDTMRVLHDGGPFYTLGLIRGSKVYENYFVNSKKAEAGIYNDNGSRFMEEFNNVIEGIPNSIWLNSGGGQMNVHDNYSDTGSTINRTDSEIVDTYVAQDGNWPKEARDIMERAGLEDKSLKALVPDNQCIVCPSDTFMSKDGIFIWTADYMPGGNGVGYYDTTNGNMGGQYRNDDVDIWNSSTMAGRYDVGVDAGEWLKYEKTIPKDGTYNLTIWASSQSTKEPRTSYKLYVDDELIVDETPLLYTDGSSVYRYNRTDGIKLTGGKHIFKLEGLYGFFGITYMQFTPVADGYNSADYNEGIIELPIKEFDDIQNHWAHDDIMTAFENGIVKGYDENNFVPDGLLTKEQAVRMIQRASFKEEGTDWAADALSMGLISENETDNGNITRLQFAKMLFNLKKTSLIDIGYDRGAYEDTADLTDDGVLYVCGVKSLGLMQGDGNNMFRPYDTLTRAEAVTVINRLK